MTTANSINGVTLRVPSDNLQHIQFEGCAVCVIAPEDYDALQFELTSLRLSATASEQLLRKIEATLPHMGGNAMSTSTLLTDIRAIRAKEARMSAQEQERENGSHYAEDDRQYGY